MSETQEKSRPVGIAIVEDMRPIREGLGTLISATEGFRLAGSYGTIAEALAGFAADTPDVALVDLGLPGTHGLDGIPMIREKFPDTSILVLTVYEDDDRIFRALCAGADGYLLKKTPPDKLLGLIREAVEGGAPMSPEVARRAIALFRNFKPKPAEDHDLTPHEARLLKMLVEGHNYKTAAEALGVSVNTISFHVRSIYRKLQVHSKAEAVAKALREGIVR